MPSGFEIDFKLEKFVLFMMGIRTISIGPHLDKK
jgi:hypothetical protein